MNKTCIYCDGTLTEFNGYIVCDKCKINRTLACILVFVFSVILGLLSTLGYGIWAEVKIIGMQFLDFFDFISNSVLMPIVAFLTCIFVGYVIKPKTLTDEIDTTAPDYDDKKYTLDNEEIYKAING